MAKQKRGTRSILFDAPPILTAWASVAGKKESEGPLQAYFDYTNGDTYFGEKTWEKAECHMQEIALETLLQKAGKKKQDVDLVFSGDLLNQCISSSFSLRNTGLPALGLYGACSTMGGVSALGLNGRLRRLCRPGGGHDLLPLCLLRAAVPLSPGLWWSAESHCSVDRNRFRCGAGLQQRRRTLCRGRHGGDHCGSGYHRCQQHGSRHGSQRL